MHALMEEGLLNGALRLFEAKRSTGHYHQQCHQHVFRNWFQNQWLPHLPMRCVIVMERGPFHMVGQDSIMPHRKRSLPLAD